MRGRLPAREGEENWWREGFWLEAPFRLVDVGVRNRVISGAEEKGTVIGLGRQGHLWTCVWDSGSRRGGVYWGCTWARCQ